MGVGVMKRLWIGPLDIAVLYIVDGHEMFIDWRMSDIQRRWRISLAWGHDLFVPFHERHRVRKPLPKRWRIGPLRIAWYAPGVE
jgi:hypothetical protein